MCSFLKGVSSGSPSRLRELTRTGAPHGRISSQSWTTAAALLAAAKR